MQIGEKANLLKKTSTIRYIESKAFNKKAKHFKCGHFYKKSIEKI